MPISHPTWCEQTLCERRDSGDLVHQGAAVLVPLGHEGEVISVRRLRSDEVTADDEQTVDEDGHEVMVSDAAGRVLFVAVAAVAAELADTIRAAAGD